MLLPGRRCHYVRYLASVLVACVMVTISVTKAEDTFNSHFAGAIRGSGASSSDASAASRGGGGDMAWYAGQEAVQLYEAAREEAVNISERGSDECKNWRMRADQRCTDPKKCGKGWLFHEKQLLLVIPGITNGGNDDHDHGNNLAYEAEWHAGESRTVRVVGLRDQQYSNGDEQHGLAAKCNAEDVSILLRLHGPEALVEAAVPVEGQCAWTVVFTPTIGGEYVFDATIMNWRGGVDFHKSRCNEVAGMHGEGSVKMDAVPSTGGPFYAGSEGCCALCTRQRSCVGWSATINPSMALVRGDRCALFSSVDDNFVDDEKRESFIVSGTSRSEETMMYLAPSMSIGKSWCDEDNSQILGSGIKFTVIKRNGKHNSYRAPSNAVQGQQHEDTKVSAMPVMDIKMDIKSHSNSSHGSSSDGDGDGDEELPFCKSNLLHDGRWVSLEAVDCPFDRNMARSQGWPSYDKGVFGKSMPEECFLKPQSIAKTVDRIHALEMHELELVEPGYVWKPYDCRYDLMNAESRTACFTNLNVTRFLDFGDSLISTSRIPRTALWLPNGNPKTWSTGRSRPLIAKGADHAGCFGASVQYYGEDTLVGLKSGIDSKDGHEGDEQDANGSVDSAVTTRYCGVEARWQESNQFLSTINSFSPDVVLANWALVHRLWHNSLESVELFAEKLGRQLDEAFSNGHKPRYMFWLPVPFIVSEREPHCVLERGLQYNAALREVLEPRGWIEVNWVLLTKQWGLDIVDGMHHGQLPARMLAYLLVHHVCHNPAD